MPRGVGVFNTMRRGLGGGSRDGVLDAWPLFSLGIMEKMMQHDSVSEVCLISGTSERVRNAADTSLRKFPLLLIYSEQLMILGS